ncbi:MAG: thiamine phosphate synthase [Desulfobacterales bacterium]|nr:thiamine phosphate synthase [Desulfobacterales bacterium]
MVKAMIDSGVTLIQYREKEKSMLEKYRQCEAIRKLTQQAGVSFIVNDHIDLALAVDADGVHVGQDDLPVEVVRELVGKEKIIGLSTHSPQQARKAVEVGADYIGVGPIFSTKTKMDVCDPVGLSYLEYVVKKEKIPFVAIGGIKTHNLAQVKACGAETIALVTEVVGAEDIVKQIDIIRKIMERK